MALAEQRDEQARHGAVLPDDGLAHLAADGGERLAQLGRRRGRGVVHGEGAGAGVGAGAAGAWPWPYGACGARRRSGLVRGLAGGRAHAVGDALVLGGRRVAVGLRHGAVGVVRHEW